jgi:hypothetical protein
MVRDTPSIANEGHFHMTWNNLKRFIESMHPEDREREVKFIEPYDKERAGYCVDVHYAVEDLTVGSGDDSEAAFIRAGEPFLR